MSRSEPRITAWREVKEIIALRELLFPVETDPELHKKQIEGTNKIKIYESKQKLPQLMIISKQLILLKHELIRYKQTGEGGDFLRLSISMTLIKFVNGLLDPLQLQFIVPLTVLAQRIGLPNWLVELRHDSTHKELKSLEMLEIGLDSSIEWIYKNYWDKIKAEKVEDEIEKLFKSYRRILRDAKDNEMGKCIAEIVKRYDKNEELLISLLNKFIMKYKYEQGLVLFDDLFNYLFTNRIDVVVSFVKLINLKIFENDQDVKKYRRWNNHLVVDEIAKYKDEEVLKVIEVITKFDKNEEILVKIQELNDNQEIKNKIESKLSKKRKVKDEDVDVDLFADLENLKKRVKLNRKPKIFEVYNNWEPKPFGVL